MKNYIQRIWSLRTTLHIWCHTTVTKTRRRLRAQGARQQGRQASITTTARTEQHLHIKTCFLDGEITCEELWEARLV
jgi:hypothetical protein